MCGMCCQAACRMSQTTHAHVHMSFFASKVGLAFLIMGTVYMICAPIQGQVAQILNFWNYFFVTFVLKNSYATGSRQ